MHIFNPSIPHRAQIPHNFGPNPAILQKIYRLFRFQNTIAIFINLVDIPLDCHFLQTIKGVSKTRPGFNPMIFKIKTRLLLMLSDHTLQHHNRSIEFSFYSIIKWIINDSYFTPSQWIYCAIYSIFPTGIEGFIEK